MWEGQAPDSLKGRPGVIMAHGISAPCNISLQHLHTFPLPEWFTYYSASQLAIPQGLPLQLNTCPSHTYPSHTCPSHTCLQRLAPVPTDPPRKEEGLSPMASHPVLLVTGMQRSVVHSIGEDKRRLKEDRDDNVLTDEGRMER